MSDREAFEKWIKEFVAYDCSTGILYWIKSPNKRTNAGSVAGRVRSCGYVKIGCNGKTFMAHRVAWFLHHGAWPEKQIDHINRNKSDNRIANLRDVPQHINMRNTNLSRKNCVTGYPGVRYRPDRKNCWRTEIKVDNKTIALGCYQTAQQAHDVYLDAKRRLHGYQ
jgi:hypothetical protein